MATRSAKPALASHAEKASISMGEAEALVIPSLSVQRDRAMNRASIIPSKHRRADKRWDRWKVKPVRPKVKAIVKVKCVRVIRWLRDFLSQGLSII